MTLADIRNEVYGFEIITIRIISKKIEPIGIIVGHEIKVIKQASDLLLSHQKHKV